MDRRARHSAALLGLALFTTLRAWAVPVQKGRASAADAEPAMRAVIEVERAPGSELCPDSESVFRSIARLFPERVFQRSTDVYTSDASARVMIRPLASGHEATISAMLPRRSERIIVEKDADCRGLADALALAFVMLVQPPDAKSLAAAAVETSVANPDTGTPNSAPCDSASKAPPLSEVSRLPDPVCAPASAPARNSSARTTPDARRVRAELGASAVAGLGVLNEPAWGAAVGIELNDQSGWGVSLQGVRAWSSPHEASGGSITLTLWGMLVGPCYRARLRSASSLDACLRLGVGSQHAEVDRFLMPQSGNFTWLTLTPTLGYRLGFLESLSGFLRIGPIVQLRKQSLSVIDEAGAIAPIETGPSVGVLAELGVNFGREFLLTRFEQRQ